MDYACLRNNIELGNGPLVGTILLFFLFYGRTNKNNTTKQSKFEAKHATGAKRGKTYNHYQGGKTWPWCQARENMQPLQSAEKVINRAQQQNWYWTS